MACVTAQGMHWYDHGADLRASGIFRVPEDCCPAPASFLTRGERYPWLPRAAISSSRPFISYIPSDMGREVATRWPSPGRCLLQKLGSPALVDYDHGRLCPSSLPTHPTPSPLRDISPQNARLWASISHPCPDIALTRTRDRCKTVIYHLQLRGDQPVYRGYENPLLPLPRLPLAWETGAAL